MGKIEEQKRFASKWLELFRGYGLDVYVAGGAPRDWDEGRPGRDIDFFFPVNGVDRETILRSFILPEWAQPLGRGHYSNQGFTVYELGIEGQLCNLILRDEKTIEETVSQFPANISQVWWDGVSTHSTPLYQLGRRYGFIIMDWGTNPRYVDKLLPRYPYHAWYGTQRDCLQYHYWDIISPAVRQ